MSFSFLQHTSVYLLIFSSLLCFSQTKFEIQDIFSLQYANEIQISPDGKTIVYKKKWKPRILSHGLSNTDNLFLIR